jgi:hypothetical protein
MIITSHNTVRIIADARKREGLLEGALHSELFVAVAGPVLLLLVWEIGADPSARCTIFPHPS